MGERCVYQGMNLKNYLRLTEDQLNRYEELYSKYRMLYEKPEQSEPMIIINTLLKGLPGWEERLADPIVMLKAELDEVQAHLEVGDDRVPTARVQFGTAQVAAAFGCEMFVPANNLPAAGSHVLKNARDIFDMEQPSLTAGWYGKLREWTEIFLENLPEGVHIQHPDIQSTFNSAHLIRGNGIFLDFYDDPEALDALLDRVTDYMIDLVPSLKELISSDRDWFFDWGALWKGAARISNCSMHMISPEMYFTHVMPRDIRLMKAIGGGRVHYCGTSGAVIDEFFKIPEITGLDFDGKYHDLWDLSRRAPEKLVLLWGGGSAETQNSLVDKLLNGGWPQKRNIILFFNASSVEEGKELYRKLKVSLKDMG